MYNLLSSGVEVLKHGRKGKPKSRYLYCDYDMTKLFWRESRESKHINANGPYTTNGSRESMDNLNGSSSSSHGHHAFGSTRSKSFHENERNSSFNTNNNSSNNISGTNDRESLNASNGNFLSRNRKTGGGLFNIRTDSEREFYFQEIIEV